MDAYEDRLRLSALTRLLGEGRGGSLLDAGCGSGRWSVRLAQCGWIVTGVDFSAELIKLAPAAPNVTYVTSAIQDARMPASSFDAWLSVTALQHVTAPAEFEAALDNLTRMLKPGGTAAVLEYSPLVRMGEMPGHIRARTRLEWIDALTSRAYTKRAETGIRFLGHGPYMIAVRLLRRRGPTRDAFPRLRSACWALDLALARVPVLTRAADVRLLVFEKPR